MPQSLSAVFVHMTFSTKGRARAIGHPDVRERLDAYAVGILRKLGCPSVAAKAVIDHMHILYIQARTVATATVAEVVKKETSRWLKEQKPELRDPWLLTFAWQNGYAAFSVSASKVEDARRYIGDQEMHHQRMTFQDEYRQLLKKHGVEYDERYVWD